MTSALIIGGGVAGPVAAMALQRAGIHATIYEAHASGADDVGAFLTLQSNGMDALRAIDAHHVVQDLGFATPSMRFYSGTGKYLGEVPNGAVLPDGTVSHTLRRSHLYRALRDEALRRGANVVYAKRLVDAQALSGGVTATFSDGSHAEADLLVGADGVRSRVRGIIDPSAPSPRYVPVLNIGGYARNVSTSARPGEYHMVFGKRAFFGYVIAPDGETWWFANPPRAVEPSDDELAAMTSEQWRGWLCELFASDASPAVELIQATQAPLRGWATYDIPSVPRWHNDAMVIIGDAAHATSPASGQGASMAIEDAIVLAKCLRDLPTPAQAFDAYVRLRRDRVERVVAQGARWSNSKAAGPVARVIRDLILPIFLRRAAGRGATATAWMHQHHIDWHTPSVGWARHLPGVEGAGLREAGARERASGATRLSCARAGPSCSP